MKRYLLFIGLVFSSCFAFAQNIDSLLTLLKTDKEDTDKVKHLNNLSPKLADFVNSNDFKKKDELSVINQYNTSHKK